MPVIAGIDLGGTAVNYTLVDFDGRFLIEGLCEHPARSVEGPDVCLQQIDDGLAMAAAQARVDLADIAVVGLDTPGPASATGVLSARRARPTSCTRSGPASTCLPASAASWDGPVTYLNDGNAGALWGHVSIFGTGSRQDLDLRASSAPASAAA